MSDSDLFLVIHKNRVPRSESFFQLYLINSYKTYFLKKRQFSREYFLSTLNQIKLIKAEYFTASSSIYKIVYHNYHSESVFSNCTQNLDVAF